METAYIALGSNLPSAVGSPRQTLDAAISRIALLGTVTARSAYYETAPVGYDNQPTFLNAAIALTTSLEPQPLLEQLLEIELEFGRDRSHGIRNGPRTLDLDLLLYGDRILSTPSLELPHPQMASRSFVLQPLAEIAPEQMLPLELKSIAELLRELPLR